MSTEQEFDIASALVEDEATQQPVSAPYMSYKGFQNFLAKFSENGLPARLDGSYFGNASGSLVAQVRGTLRYLDLIDENKEPTDLLKQIVLADASDRKTLLKRIFEDKYADVLALDKNATSGQLADVFRARGLGGATVQKAITFLFGMAEDVGIELSPHFKRGRAATSNGSLRRRKVPKVAPPTVTPTPRSVHPTVTTVEEQKAAYVNMLMELAKKDNAEAGLQKDLMNRIEKALGIWTPEPREGEGTTNLP